MGDVPVEIDPSLCGLLAADLTDAGFTAQNVRDAWGSVADDAIARGLRAPAVRSLGSRDDRLAVLARLFVLGMPQPEAPVAAALPALGVAGLVALELAEAASGTVVPRALVRPQAFADAHGDGQWWIASDLDEAALQAPLPEDHVLGVGGASLTLAALQLPTPAERALDLGAGCGIQALRARRYADTVVATDISQRALRFTRLNAALNGVEGIETRAGSLFEPVSGERFDRVVSNPPFVITPRAAGVPSYEYRDGGMVGDDLVAAFVRGVGEHLEPGGIAQLLGNWETRAGVDGLERVRGWVEASPVPLDAWIVEREALDPLSYAELWIRDGGTLPGSDGFGLLVDAWLDDFAEREVTEVGFGYILLRRAVGEPTLRRFERLPQAIGDQGGLGAHLAASLAAHDRLLALDDVGLAASAVRVAPDVTEARHHLPGDEAPTVIELRQGGGFARSLSVDPGLAALVGACDGDLPIGVLTDAIAQLLEVDAAALRADLLPRVRELLFTGFLVF
ncbi:methyltransferase [Microbacterium fluvii]|uniref:Methyltransferase n=1 Tax=Microbacterium fluvii TaxID=415215 RepID=A0ABW2HFW9_9MICO|nr:methyltransferase [Microbacterium fluvii]MCU4673691.1 methyltransferase [Microbacterium fluvii]